MGFNIPRINSVLNLDQCNIHMFHGVPKLDDWLSYHGLGLWFQVGSAVFCCSQMCHGELHALIILDCSGSWGADLESKLLVVGNNPTIFIDIRYWMHRYM